MEGNSYFYTKTLSRISHMWLELSYMNKTYPNTYLFSFTWLTTNTDFELKVLLFMGLHICYFRRSFELLLKYPLKIFDGNADDKKRSDHKNSSGMFITNVGIHILHSFLCF